jgi:hypothetical protein
VIVSERVIVGSVVVATRDRGSGGAGGAAIRSGFRRTALDAGSQVPDEAGQAGGQFASVDASAFGLLCLLCAHGKTMLALPRLLVQCGAGRAREHLVSI